MPALETACHESASIGHANFTERGAYGEVGGYARWHERLCEQAIETRVEKQVPKPLNAGLPSRGYLLFLKMSYFGTPIPLEAGAYPQARWWLVGGLLVATL